MPEYADPVIDWLDGGRGLFAKKLYREACHLQSNGSYIKDLSLVEKDLSRVCFMDNSPVSYSWNKGECYAWACGRVDAWTCRRVAVVAVSSSSEIHVGCFLRRGHG